MVNKGDVIDGIAAEAGLTKKAAGAALDAFIGCVEKTLKKGDKLTIPGFGTFSVGKRAARTGRNPQTGSSIKIPAKKVPKFKAGKGLKDAV